MANFDTRRSVLTPFSPRVAEIEYISTPEQPVVFVEALASLSADCDIDYPFDPRNLSLFDTSQLNVFQLFDGTFFQFFDSELINTF